jgi:DNA polymerase-3 subunit delta
MSAENNATKSFGKRNNSEPIAVLKSHIKNKNPARVYIFYGNEPFLIDYYVGELKKLILKGNSQGLNFSVFEDKVDINMVIDACETFPIFSERKLVLVKNSGVFVGKGKKGENKGDTKDNLIGEGNRDQETLKKYIPNIPETACLIFIENQVDRRLGLFRQIEKNGLAIEFLRLSEKKLVSWVVKGFKTLGKVIDMDAAEYLVAVSEPDMYSLKNEIMKLCAYAGRRERITIDDVKVMASPTVKSVIFDLLDAVAQKNTSKALRLLSDMLFLKEPEQKIFSMLSKQTGEILKLKYLMKEGASQFKINKYFAGKHPYALKMMMKQANMLDEQYLGELLKGLMEAETRYKKGLMTPRLALETLLSRLNLSKV